MCVCLLCIFHVDAYAQNADVQQGDESSEEYVTARVVIGNTSRAFGDPNADVDGDGVRLRSGPSQVLYYNFTFGNGELVQTSSSSMKRLYNREWVVTVDSVKNNRYGITYGILDNNASEWYNSLVQRCLNNSEKQCLLFAQCCTSKLYNRPHWNGKLWRKVLRFRYCWTLSLSGSND